MTTISHANASAGIAPGDMAPVMMATVSLMLILFGFSTATRFPRRAT
jgi:hypothetical protein